MESSPLTGHDERSSAASAARSPAALPAVPADYLALPHAFGGPPRSGCIRGRLEDFQVVEDLGFEPSGEGDHLFIRVRKQGANTQWIAQRIAGCAGLPVAKVSYAGLKDRFAVTEQTFSLNLAGRPNPDFSAIEDEELRILELRRNRRMVKRGGLRGNRFRIVVRELRDADRGTAAEAAFDPTKGRAVEGEGEEPAGEARVDRAEVETLLARVGAEGVPNYFGPQRFGNGGRNLAKVQGLFQGSHQERNRHKRGLYVSAASSYLFNLVLAERVRQGIWNRALDGDTMSLDGSRSFFRTETVDEEILRRLASMDIHPSGPLWGLGKRAVAGEALALEDRVLEAQAHWREGLERWKARAKRRALRLPVRELEWAWEGDDALVLSFALPAGTYATTVLREIVDLDNPHGPAQVTEAEDGEAG